MNQISLVGDFSASDTTGTGWTAILLAGRRPGVDPLAAHFGVQSKALVAVDGEPMLSRVARCLSQTPGIRRVIVLAQDIDALMAAPEMAWASSDPRVVASRSGEGISRSILDVIRRHNIQWPVLVTTADNVLLTPQLLSHFLAEAHGCDVAVGLVSRSTMVRAYPQTRRSWLRFRGEAYTGANLFALRTGATVRALELWQDVEQDRKSLPRVAMHFGPWLLLRILLRSMRLQDAVRCAGRRLGLLARTVTLPFAEAGIDVDKPSDHALAEMILRDRRARLG